MKKLVIAAAAMILASSSSFAQDFAKATDLAKQANEALINGDTQTAVTNFTAALKEASASTEEGAAELVASCKEGISQAYYKAANDLVRDGKITEAVGKLTETISISKENGQGEISQKAAELQLQLYQKLANEQLKAASASKDPQTKVACYKAAAGYLDSVIAADGDNANAYLQKGQVLSAIGQADQAIECFLAAKEKGLGDKVGTQIANIYVKDANNLMKAGKFKESIAACQKAIENQANNANAYKIAGICSQKAGDLSGAVKFLEEYVKIKPEDVQIKQAVDAIKAKLKK